ncbi:MAG: virulence factor SrfB [Saprospiraceae bacterium]
MQVSLVANSGIQFLNFSLEIDPNADLVKSIRFWENVDMERQKIILEYAHFLVESEIWVSKRQLAEEGFLLEDGKLVEDINLTLLTPLDEENECYAINNIEASLEYFENQWIPLPFFERKSSGYFDFGPTNWARMKLVPVVNQKRTKEYTVVLIFDTMLAQNPNDKESPFISKDKDYTEFSLCGDLDILLNYCDARYDCEWVDDYIGKLVYGAGNSRPDEFPELKYLAHYIYFIKYIQQIGVLPEIQLYNNRIEDALNVDMVIDIGNSRTFGILMESPKGKAFEFTEVKELKIQDLSDPIHSYEEPFDMRLAFHQNDFGEISFHSKKFQWPSFVRVGKEAKRLIYQSTNLFSTDGTESITNHSSPKRYLWDNEESNLQWELIRTDSKESMKAIYIEGISEQFSSDGTLAKSKSLFGITSNFSRSSLMTFVFLEILAHAMVQINSFEFRRKHGDSSKPRRLRWLVVTCPTAMVKAEQIALRQSAQDAAIALNRYFSATFNEEYDERADKSKVTVIPSPKDLEKNLSQIDTRKDWIYDEATCCQLVYLYAEISKRYLNKCEKYFSLYGKKRQDLYDYDKKSITVGSIDIGAGTTDLMICAYKYEEAGTAVLTPVPLYWESFSHAGDDLLKEIIRQVILEGKIDKEEFRGCSGVIENAVRDRKIKDVESRLNNFFGPDTSSMDYTVRQMRKKFNTQISIPIAEQYLEHAGLEKEDRVVDFKELFPLHKPNAELLNFFEERFEFRFEDIKWKLSAGKVNEIIETVFEPMIKHISTLLHVKGCDFVLLAGRPASLEKINQLFLKFYPVSPDRIICLNDYRVGRWYPFQDGNGYLTDKKSIVAVGAAVAMMGGKLDQLQGFRLNMETIKEKLISTAEYFGIYDGNTSRVDKIFIEPEVNKSQIQVAGLPIMIGFKRLPAASYPGRIIYSLDFDDDKILERKLNQLGGMDSELIHREIEEYKTNLKNRMPFKIRLLREYRQDREILIIESIEDKDRESLPKSILQLKLKTMDEHNGHWKDTGAFYLRVQSK